MFKRDFISETIKVNSKNQLDSLSGYLHDEFFVLDDVLYSEGEGTVIIPYRRMFHDLPKKLVRNWLLFKVYESDIIHSLLTISNVLNCRFEDKAKIGSYSFVEVKYNNGLLIFECSPELKLELAISKIDIECQDKEIKGKTKISSGLFGLYDSYTGKEIDNKKIHR